MNHAKFVYGVELHWSQIRAMTIKRFLYSIRNYILLLIQFGIPAFFIVITMLSESVLTGDKNLPELPIEFDQYLQTVTTMEKRSLVEDSIIDRIAKSYQAGFNDLSGDHTLRVTDKDFEEEILNQYRSSVPKTNLNFMVGASFTESNDIKCWFNNQGYHTAPLAVNMINNAILR